MARHGNRKYQGVQWAARLGAVMATTLALSDVGRAETLSNQAGPVVAHSASNLVGSNASARIPPASSGMIDAFLSLNQKRYLEALVRTRSWLDTLTVNPTDLRAHGIKGKKKLAELLDVYLRLYEMAATADKQILLERIRGVTAITAVTTAPGYHDMLSVTDRQFKEDSRSQKRGACASPSVDGFPSLSNYPSHESAMRLIRRHIIDPGVIMFLVVPSQVQIEISVDIFNIPEPSRIFRITFHRAERRLDKRIVG